jgi:hypothetical protein
MLFGKQCKFENHELEFDTWVMCPGNKDAEKLSRVFERIELTLRDKIANQMFVDVGGYTNIYDFLMNNGVELLVDTKVLTDEDAETLEKSEHDSQEVLDFYSEQVPTYRLVFPHTPMGRVPVWMCIEYAYGQDSVLYPNEGASENCDLMSHRPLNTLSEYELLLDVLCDGDISHYFINGYLDNL